MRESSSELTTAALLTPPGLGAVAVIRVIGPQAMSLVRSMFRPLQHGDEGLPAADRLRCGRLYDEDEAVDDVIVACHPVARRDIDTVDICAHGGVRIAARILLALERRGAMVRAADAPAADERWWPASNRVEAEADLALARAQTRRAVRFLARQRAILPPALRQLAALAEQHPQVARRRLGDLLDRWAACRYLVHGAEVAILGPPNAGKSTLVNLLVGQEKTLASPWAGTTRDWTAHPTGIQGVPITLVDTAGVRATAHALDAAGVERGIDRSAGADLHLLVLDRGAAFPGEFLSTVSGTIRVDRLIVVVNKADLPRAWAPGEVALGQRAVVTISARTGEGVDDLVEAIVATLGLEAGDETAPCPVSDRQAREGRSLISEMGTELTGLAAGIRRLVG